MTRAARRRLAGQVATAAMGAAVLVAVLPLLLILGHVVAKGAGSLGPSFLLRVPAPAGEAGGGVANAVVGTLVMVGTASLIGVPFGLAAGLYCAEYPGSRLTWLARFVADVMNGTPSIVVGVFAWTWVVAPQRHFSAFAGSVALALLLVPMVMRTTEEMVRLVPDALREAGLALGYSRWRVTLGIVVPSTLPGIVTGTLLAVSRIAGETAPLLFTALGSAYLTTALDQPMAALPLTVFQYATGPYPEWHRFAWGAALVLVLLVLGLNLAARYATRPRLRRG